MNYQRYLAIICTTLFLYCCSILPYLIDPINDQSLNINQTPKSVDDFIFENYTGGSTVAIVEIATFNINRVPVNELRNYHYNNLICQLIRDKNIFNNSRKYQFQSLNNEGRFECTDIIYPSHYFW